jgi:hypothetical protein
MVEGAAAEASFCSDMYCASAIEVTVMGQLQHLANHYYQLLSDTNQIHQHYQNEDSYRPPLPVLASRVGFRRARPIPSLYVVFCLIHLIDIV